MTRSTNNLRKAIMSSHRPDTRAAKLAILIFAVSLCTGTAAATDRFVEESTGIQVTEGEFEQLFGPKATSYGSPLTIAASAFRSTGANPTGVHLGFLDALHGNDSVNAYAVAPVYLPAGATISYMGAGVGDGIDTTGPCSGSSQRNVDVYLYRVDNYSGDVDIMSSLVSSGSSPDPQYLLDSNVEFPTIDYPYYSYYAVTKLCHSAHVFYTVQVLYTMP